MRIAPVIVANKDSLNDCIQDTVNQSQLTHGSSLCLEYASLLAEELWTGKPLKKFKYKKWFCCHYV